MGIENSQDLWTSVPSTLNDPMRQKQVINNGSYARVGL